MRSRPIFHWELEFPDVFRDAGSGFDAILGNPPWDVAKPVSKEFFSEIDPLYRSYGKQEALCKQSDYFEDPAVERGWLDYNARFRAQSNFVSHAANPFGDPGENPKSQSRFAVARGGENRELCAMAAGPRAMAAGPRPPPRRLQRSGASLPPPGLRGSQPVQALPRSRPRAVEASVAHRRP